MSDSYAKGHFQDSLNNHKQKHRSTCRREATFDKYILYTNIKLRPIKCQTPRKMIQHSFDFPFVVENVEGCRSRLRGSVDKIE